MGPCIREVIQEQDHEDLGKQGIVYTQLAASMIGCLLRVGGCFVPWVTSSSFIHHQVGTTLVPAGLRSNLWVQPRPDILNMQGSRWCAPEVLDSQTVSCSADNPMD